MTAAKRSCSQCGGPLVSTNPRAQLCSATCRQRARRERARNGVTVAPAEVPVERPMAAFGSEAGGMVRATLAELEGLGRVDHYLGQIALALARQIDSGRDSGSVAASLMRELRNTMAAARVGASSKDDPIDQLAERRRARVFGA